MSQPNDVDVKALLRMAVVYNVPTACNRATADLIISSPRFHSEEYKSKKQNLSVCHVLEGMILGYLEATVYLSNTIRPLKIENLVVERAVKRVRRYEKIEEVEEDILRCGFENCHNPAVAKGLYQNDKEYLLCKKHLIFVKIDRKNWINIKELP